MIDPHAPEDASDTRARLLRTALHCFGHRDLDGVGVREIVDHAAVNIAAVSYHFGGKQGLYLATAEFLADSMQQRLGPLLERIAAEVPSTDREQAIAQLRDLVRGLVQGLLFDPLGDDAAGFILREQQRPTAAFDVLYERLMLPIQRTYQVLVTRLLGDRGPDPDGQIIVVHALIGQILAFRIARTTVLRRLGRADFSSRDVHEITEQICNLSLNALGVRQPWRIP